MVQIFRDIVMFWGVYIFPWMLGYMFASRKSTKFISIDMPKWVKRILFIKNIRKKINIFVIIWQMMVYCNYIYLVLVFLGLNNKVLDNIYNAILSNLTNLFLIFCIIGVIDGVIAEFFPEFRA